jgi:hypothetical protein
MRPWYVGMTVVAAGFKGEAFQPHKVDLYNECLSKRRGTAHIFFLPLCLQENYKFSKNKSQHKKEMQWLETTLMGFAYRQNSNVSNVRRMYYLRNVEVSGLLGKRRPGRPSREAGTIRSILLGSSFAKPQQAHDVET